MSLSADLSIICLQGDDLDLSLVLQEFILSVIDTQAGVQTT